MARKRMPGLRKVGNIWHIEKKVNGRRLCESTGANNLEEAEKYLIRRLEGIRQATVYGIRPKRIFREAATKFLQENQHKKSIHEDASKLRMLDSFIGDMPLEAIHMGSLQPYVKSRRKDGVKARTINYGFQVVRRILNLAAGEWMDEHGLTWLAAAPKIKLLSQHDARKPYPLDWEEQDRLFTALAPHLREMALFGVNTGCRNREICRLRWSWEVKVPIPEIGTVFVIPGEYTKNGEDRVVVLNQVARQVIEKRRNQHPEFVFTFRGKPTLNMLNNGWCLARKKAGLEQLRVHDLKHTFGRRLRSAGVSFEDRQDLLGHKSARITTHYSSAELLNLWEAANKVCEGRSMRPTLTLLRWDKNKDHTIVGHEKSTKSVFSGSVQCGVCP